MSEAAAPAPRLEPAGRGLWLAEGSPVSFYGFPYPTRAAIVRLSEGSLWVWSPIDLDPALRAEVEALGPVRFLVEPNKLHHLALGSWARAFPEARTYAPPGLARKRPDLRFDAELGDTAPPEWNGEIEQVAFRGSPLVTELVFHHRASSTALVCDLIQKMEPRRGWRGLLLRLNGLVGPAGGTPREWRATFLRRGPAREALRTALAWHPRNLVIAHGRCVFGEGERALREALGWLRPGAPAGS